MGPVLFSLFTTLDEGTECSLSRELGGVADTPTGCADTQPDREQAGEMGREEPKGVQAGFPLSWGRITPGIHPGGDLLESSAGDKDLG